MNSAMQIASEISLIYDGRILWKGSREELHKSDNPYLNQFINGRTDGPISVNI
ncbi:MAG: hypothetical protein KA998_00525 [Rickettsiaceae bacterium]|nr:hypothetical protein [Rickettsiaceae bacterium]